MPLKAFSRKHEEIPVLTNYQGTLSDEYWSHWTKRSYHSIAPAKSWICPNKLEKLVKKLGYRSNRLNRVLERLKNGADIGCKGPGRLSTRMPNSQSASEYEDRVADALQDWIKEGIAYVRRDAMG